MIENVKETMKIYLDLDNEDLFPLINDYKIGEKCDTIFRYELDNNSFESAIIGINDLEMTIPLLMTFITTITSIKIINKINNGEKTISKSNEIKMEFINILEYKFNSNIEEENKKILIANINDENSSICLEIKDNNDNFYEILPKNKKIPTFFVDFPDLKIILFLFILILIISIQMNQGLGFF